VPRLLYLVTEDWYFWSHRLPVARAARDAGYDVLVATRVDRHAELITAEGFRLVSLGLRRSSRNPLREIWSILEIARVYRRERPDIVHHVALKPVLYGSLAALLTRVPVVINALAGLGFVFSSHALIATLLRLPVRLAFQILLRANRGVLILQNPDDESMFGEQGLMPAKRIRLIRGSGVDTERFPQTAEPAGRPIVMVASRMLWDKGVGEFVEAAKLLTESGVRAAFVLVGDGDPENPATIPDDRLRSWVQEGIVEWWGRRDDMAAVLSQASIVCLPSYREGLPKVLLEAASCGRALVATDVPGCREIVLHNENGILVPLKDSRALARAIETLLSDPALRTAMGNCGRKLVEEQFSSSLVARQTMNAYVEASSEKGTAS